MGQFLIWMSCWEGEPEETPLCVPGIGGILAIESLCEAGDSEVCSGTLLAPQAYTSVIRIIWIK